MDDWVFVSPHLDDVALSCGGAVAKGARIGSPRIVTVFAGEPGDELGEFARFQHEQWELPDAVAVKQRREEDRRAAAQLGSSVQLHWLEYRDAIYRDAGYSSDDALFASPLKCDMTLAEDIYRDLRELGSSSYVLPMGVGNHVDHQIVREAGLMLLRDAAEIWLYAEIPYALDEAKLAFALAQVHVSESLRVSLDDDSLSRKCAAVSEYASQLPVLFRDHGNPCDVLEAFHRRQGGGKPAELLWRLLPESDPFLTSRPFVA